MNLESVIREAVVRQVGNVDFVVEHPADEKKGDWASNVAMVVAKVKGEDPRDVAGSLVDKLGQDKELTETFDKIEVAGPGFINFKVKEISWIGELERVLSGGKDYGRSDWGKGRRVLVDYSSPNIAKDFNVGHLRSTIIGQTIRNIYEFCGWESVGDNHLGDWGTQFGMIIAAVEEKNLEVEKMSVAEMERLYVEFNERAKENTSLRDRAKEAFVRLENGDEKARQIWKKSVDASMKEFDRIYELLGVKIENAYGESTYEMGMKEIIEEAKEKGLAYKSQGALVMDLPGLPPGMFLKSDGGTTYFTRDLATIKFRESNRELKSDLYVYEVGEEQATHFGQVFAAAEVFGWLERKKLVHVGHGLILGADGKKMSTRKGTGVKMEELLEKTIEEAAKVNRASAQKVGVGAIKYFDLKHAPTTSYKFDWQEALRLDGNNGPYLQYVVARCKGVLAKAGVEVKGLDDVEALEPEVVAVLRWLARFGEVVEEAAVKFAPNLICNYLFELAQRFNVFYDRYKVLDSGNNFRLGLVMGVMTVIESGLKLLGIETVEKM